MDAEKAQTKPTTLLKKGSIIEPLGDAMPSYPFEHVRRDFDRLCNGMYKNWMSMYQADPLSIWSELATTSPFKAFDLGTARSVFGIQPKVDVLENSDHYTFSFELPGLSEKDIEIEISDGTLTVSGKKADEHVEDTKGHYIRERSFGSFERSFQLPSNAAENDIVAAFDKGILTVTVPMVSASKKPSKKIPVKSK